MLLRRTLMIAAAAFASAAVFNTAQAQLTPAQEAAVNAQMLALVRANPNGGSALAEGVENLLVNNPQAAATVLAFAANPTISAGAITAIASGYNAAAIILAASNPAGAATLNTVRATATPAVAAALVATGGVGGPTGGFAAGPGGAGATGTGAASGGSGFGGAVTDS